MTGKLRAFLSSKTVIAIVGLALAYLAAGFLLVPALVKWQAPKLVQEKLQHELKLGDVRFNPLRLTFEVDRLVLADAAGRSMLGLDHLLVDLEARSIVEWSWTFARVALTGPRVAIELDASGRHNFRGLLERLGSDEPPSGTPKGNPNGNPPPRLIVDQLRVEGGKLEYSDRALAEPRVLSLEPISVRIDAFSTLLDRKGRYAVSARSGAGEALELAGQLGLRPLTIEGTAEIKDLALQTIARALNRQLAVGANEGKFGLSTDYALSVAADGALGGRIGKASLSASALSLSARGSPEPMLAVESLGVEGVEVDLARRRIDIESIRLARGSVATLIDAGGVLNWSALVVPAAPATEEPARVDAPATVQEARSASAPASTPTPTPGPVSPPAQEKAGSGWQLAVAKVELLGIAASFDDRVDQLGAKTDQLDLGFAAEVQTGPSATKIRLDKLILALGTPQFADAATRFKAGEASLNIASIDLVLEQAASSVAAGPLELTSSSLEIEHGGRAARIANAAFGIAGIDLAGGAEPLALRGTGLSSTIGGVAVRAMGDPADVLELGSVKLSGAELDLAARFFKLDKLSIDGGSARALVDANGELNLARLARGRARANAAPDASPSGSSVRKAAGTAAGDRSRPWRLMLAETDVSGLALEFEDRSRTPALKVALEAIALRVTQFDTASKEPVAVDAKARVRSGGTIAARGKVSPDNGAAELKLAVSRLALAPVQPVLSQYALLTLGSGALSIDGRLRYGTGGVAPATLAYEGRFAIDSLLLEEIEPRRTFLAWKSVATDDMKLTLGPDRVDIGELRVDGLVSRLVIAQDQSVNLSDVLKREPAASGGTSARVPPPAADAGQGDPFPVTIARLRIDRGELEFADLSLRPQFGTRMHELKGVITGLGTSVRTRAKLQLEARVDEFGSARISGEILPFRAREFTDIEMAFRNLEMTSMSPYSIKFAGHRIESGKLSLDLQYKVESGKLKGENKAVLSQIELGERVESPDALDLPLELAIALLKDADGIIDVEVPVSGDLEDPQFSYGSVIWKAIGNLIARIVTAPFRALGALFGAGDSEEIDSIEFTAGSAALEPPQKAKLKSIAAALAKRPKLELVVPPTYSLRVDEAAMKSDAVRRAVVIAMGVKIDAQEDPGPLDAANPRTRSAIEAEFSRRYAPQVLSVLKSRATQAATRAASAAAASGAAPAAAGQAPGAAKPDPSSAPATTPGIPDEFYENLVQRMIEETTIERFALEQLARKRAEAVVADLTGAAGLAATRVALGEVREASADAARDAPVRAATGEGAPPAQPKAAAPVSRAVGASVTMRLQLEAGK